MKRLRVFDLATPWFWVVAFYFGKRYGNPTFELSVYPPAHGNWFYLWKWEPVPDPLGAYAALKEVEP